MPTKEEHLKKAHHNEAFIESFEVADTPFLDWIVTAAFYAAVHYIEAYLASHDSHSQHHRARDSELVRDPGLKQIHSVYRQLKDDSTNARYVDLKFKPEEITDQVFPRLQVIRKHILSQV